LTFSLVIASSTSCISQDSSAISPFQLTADLHEDEYKQVHILGAQHCSSRHSEEFKPPISFRSICSQQVDRYAKNIPPFWASSAIVMGMKGPAH
jgi:hypothetical protein